MKTIRLERSWIVRAPREKVYEIMTDFEKVPEYFPGVAKSARIASQQGNRPAVEVETLAFRWSGTFRVHNVARPDFVQPLQG